MDSRLRGNDERKTIWPVDCSHYWTMWLSLTKDSK